MPKSSWDEMDGALKIQMRREERLNSLRAAASAAADSGESPVDADGLVNFDVLYTQAGVLAVPFTAERRIAGPERPIDENAK